MTPLHYIAVRSDGLRFMQCAEECIRTPELLVQVDRLYGTTFTARRSGIEILIDQACGRDDADMQTLLRFVWNCIFIRTPKIDPEPGATAK